MTLQAKLDAFKADFKGGKAPYFAPPEIHPIMERATAELVASGQAGRALKAGDGAPVFTLNDQNKLDFPILSDTHNDVAAAFGLGFALPDYLVDLYKSLKNDLPAFDDDPAWTLPMSTRYVIGHDGVIAYAEVKPDYTRRPEPDNMLPVLQQLLATTV
ncbi:hypothetical protein ACL58G_24805 [Massilia sp. GER05]|uniref:hypothetical protein n=1 Tax=Massilia sp. GER05 TaxID=3394605 RepID=UPI003F87F7CA